MLVSAPRADASQLEADAHIAELAKLADTAGARVVGRIMQRIKSPNARSYLGSGKVRELAALAKSRGAGLLVFDDELSPTQAKNLAESTGTRVVDRTELILDIFASRARSYEARLQVELAQLQYLLPRLRRMWSHLSRIQGGIGFRGPGETQLETDRRLVGRRIGELKRKLRGVRRAARTRSRGRRGLARVALVGYTNAGKSSILAALSGTRQLVEDRLFATLDATTRAVQVGLPAPVLVTDTVGFIRKLPHHLVASFRSTLSEARQADALLHVVDGAHPEWRSQHAVVLEVLEEMGILSVPRITVFNKIDLLSSRELLELRAQGALGPRFTGQAAQGSTLFVSARHRPTLESLREALSACARKRMETVEVLVPAGDGATLSRLHRESEVLATESNGDALIFTTRAPASLIGRLRRRDGVRILSPKQKARSLHS